MSFRIEKQKALLAAGFRAALREQIALSIKDLDISSRVSRAARIHSARKRVKKVRSILRLLEAAAFPGVSRADHDLLRDASTEVAVPRSADANLNTLKLLCSDSGSDHLRFSRTFAALERQKLAASRGTQASMHKAATLLKGALSRIDAWDDRSIPWEDVRRGLEQFYKRGRAAFRKVAEEGTTENFHLLRKRAKDILHGLRLIAAGKSKTIRRRARQMKKLGALLGTDHDLALLREILDQFRIGREKVVLEKLIAARRRKVQGKALELGAKYFSRKPGEFVEKIDGQHQA